MVLSLAAVVPSVPGYAAIVGAFMGGVALQMVPGQRQGRRHPDIAMYHPY